MAAAPKRRSTGVSAPRRQASAPYDRLYTVPDPLDREGISGPFEPPLARGPHRCARRFGWPTRPSECYQLDGGILCVTLIRRPSGASLTRLSHSATRGPRSSALSSKGPLSAPRPPSTVQNAPPHDRVAGGARRLGSARWRQTLPQEAAAQAVQPLLRPSSGAPEAPPVAARARQAIAELCKERGDVGTSAAGRHCPPQELG